MLSETSPLFLSASASAASNQGFQRLVDFENAQPLGYLSRCHNHRWRIHAALPPFAKFALGPCESTQQLPFERRHELRGLFFGTLQNASESWSSS